MKLMPIIETNVGILCTLTFLCWNIVMDDWKWMEIYLVCDNNRILQIYNPQIFLQGMKTNDG